MIKKKKTKTIAIIITIIIIITITTTIKAMKTKITKIKINKITKMKINEIKTKIIKAKRRVNSKIQISTIIFTIKEFCEKCASTRKRKMRIIKNLVNMFFIKRLCNIRAYKNRFLIYLNVNNAI